MRNRWRASTTRAPSDDYPRTFEEMEQWFRDEAACRTHIRRLRWSGGFVCPHCGVKEEPRTMSDELLRCRSCGARTSLTAGAIFEGTRKALSAAVSPNCRRPVDRPRPASGSLCGGPTLRRLRLTRIDRGARPDTMALAALRVGQPTPLAAAGPTFALAQSTASPSRSSPQKTSPSTTKVGEPKTPRALASSVWRW